MRLVDPVTNQDVSFTILSGTFKGPKEEVEE